MNKPIKIINPLTVSERHINQLVNLLITTGYFEYCGLGNKLKLDLHEATKINFVLPSLKHTKVIMDDLNNIAGFYVASTKAQDCKKDMDPNNIRDDQNVYAAIQSIYTLYNMIAEDDYILSYFAVRFDLQGLVFSKYAKKISELLFEEIILDAHQSKSNSLKIITWASHASAVKLYQRFNGELVETIDLSHSIFADKLLLINIMVG